LFPRELELLIKLIIKMVTCRFVFDIHFDFDVKELKIIYHYY